MLGHGKAQWMFLFLSLSVLVHGGRSALRSSGRRSSSSRKLAGAMDFCASGKAMWTLRLQLDENPSYHVWQLIRVRDSISSETTGTLPPEPDDIFSSGTGANSGLPMISSDSYADQYVPNGFVEVSVCLDYLALYRFQLGSPDRFGMYSENVTYTLTWNSDSLLRASQGYVAVDVTQFQLAPEWCPAILEWQQFFTSYSADAHKVQWSVQESGSDFILSSPARDSIDGGDFVGLQLAGNTTTTSESERVQLAWNALLTEEVCVYAAPYHFHMAPLEQNETFAGLYTYALSINELMITYYDPTFLNDTGTLDQEVSIVLDPSRYLCRDAPPEHKIKDNGKNCYWLALENTTVIEQECQDDDAKALCPATCGVCNPPGDCMDDFESTFVIEGRSRGCSWLSKRRWLWDIACQLDQPPATICPKLCGHCAQE